MAAGAADDPLDRLAAQTRRSPDQVAARLDGLFGPGASDDDAFLRRFEGELVYLALVDAGFRPSGDAASSPSPHCCAAPLAGGVAAAAAPGCLRLHRIELRGDADQHPRQRTPRLPGDDVLGDDLRAALGRAAGPEEPAAHAADDDDVGAGLERPARSAGGIEPHHGH